MIGIVMLNYNGWKLSKNCIESIRKNTNIHYKIYLVDNASTELMSCEIKEFIKNSEDLNLIINKYNKGYSAGNNIGIKQALDEKCDEILITNNDVIFSHNCIDNMQRYLRNNKKIGIIGPKVFLKDGRIQEINMGCKMTIKGKYMYILRKTVLKFLTLDFIKAFHAKEKNLDKPFEVYGVSGCCFMMSTECSKELYPFDENTFLYEEENIIGTRMEKLGLKTIYYTLCTIIHLGSESTKSISDFAYSCFVESEIYYCRKYLAANHFQILPLYILRSIKYIQCFRLNNIKKYFFKTQKMLWKRL